MNDSDKEIDDTVRCVECGEIICEGETARRYKGDWLCEDCRFIEKQKHERKNS